GTLNCLEPVTEAMKAQGHGVIAIVGSLAGYVGLTHAGAYCASKSALMRLAETLRAELRGFGVDVRLISPGFVKTPLTDRNDFPMPFLLERDDAVRRIRRGLDSNRFEIAFPRRLQWSLQLLSVLPKPLYFRALKSMLRDDRKLAK
ncbi:MAG: SDR family NAD(P)-dependent oxidoreductase, partial [Oricola sp.]|nr:SDR family NAD(P)-dependent oxidoreductase [Oricola sp.]